MGCDSQVSLMKDLSNQAFSILERIEWAATTLMPYLHHVVVSFQYPRTDRMGCDTGVEKAIVGMMIFQYPRTDRMGCDRAQSDAPAIEDELSVSSNGSNGLRLVR